MKPWGLSSLNPHPSTAAPLRRARQKIKLFYSVESVPKGSVAHLSHFGHTFVTHLSHAM